MTIKKRLRLNFNEMWWWQSAGGGTKRKNVCSGLSPSDATAACRRPARHHTQIPMLIILWHIFKYTGEVCIIYHFLCPQNEYLMQVLLFPPFSLLLLWKKSPNSLSRLVLRCLHVYGPFVILALKIVLKVGKELYWQETRPDDMMVVYCGPVMWSF